MNRGGQENRRIKKFSLLSFLQTWFQADQEKQAAREKEEAERQAKEAEEKRQKEKADKIREARVRKLSARLPPEPKEEKTEGKPVAQLRFRIPATLTRDEDMTNGEQTKNGIFFLNSISLLQIF